MTERNYQRLRKKIDTHTKHALFDWADRGNGANTILAVKSALRLEDFVEQLVADEVALAFSAARGPG